MLRKRGKRNIGRKLELAFELPLLFLSSYIVSSLIIESVKIRLVSTIDLRMFSLWISLVTVSAFLTLSGKIRLNLKDVQISYLNKIKIFSLTSLILIASLSSLIFKDLRAAFIEWDKLPNFSIVLFLTTFLIIYYGPGYVTHTVFLKCKWNTVERAAFYPALSIPLLVFSTVICNLIGIPENIFLTALLTITLLALLYNANKNLRKTSQVQLSKNIDLGLLLAFIFATGFNLFIFHSAIGSEGAFLRGDMYGDTHKVAFLNKYGFTAYISSLGVGGYPPLFSLFWSAVLRLTSFPFINGLIIVAFFNHVYSLISFYLLSKLLLEDPKRAMLSVILWTTLSGFSWFFLLSNPPSSVLSGSSLLEFISRISQHFGVYSGSIVSPTYADGHTLTRLWSLSLFFLSLSTLIKIYQRNNDEKTHIPIFILLVIIILLGHVTEVPLISIAMFILVIFGNKKNRFLKSMLFISLILTIASILLSVIIYGLDHKIIFISLTPFLATFFATILSQTAFFFKRHFPLKIATKNIVQNLKKTALICILYVYYLMLLAFSQSKVFINWPIATLWYSPAIEWGFLGLFSTLSIIYLGLTNKKWSFGLKFTLLTLIFQLLLIIALNYLNYNFSYFYTPYPIQPLLFLPFLAIISSHIFPLSTSKDDSKMKKFLPVFFVVVILSVGSLDHVLSASYWKTNNGWWLGKPLNPSKEDYELINFLYSFPKKSNYEFVGTFYDWTYPSSYVIYPSGMVALSEPLIEILRQANDSREIFLLTSVFPINYILVAKQQPPPSCLLATMLAKTNPIFRNSKYELYLTSQLDLQSTNLLPASNVFLTVKKIEFVGEIKIRDEYGSMTILKEARGEILPIGEGYAKVIINSLKNNTENIVIIAKSLIEIDGNITFYNLKSTWRHFEEIKCSAEKLTIRGWVSFKIFNTFDTRIYAEKFAYNGKYEAFPQPTYLRPDYAKEQIKHYFKVNHIEPLAVIMSHYGIMLTFIITITLIAIWMPFNLRKIRIRMFKQTGVHIKIYLKLRAHEFTSE